MVDEFVAVIGVAPVLVVVVVCRSSADSGSAAVVAEERKLCEVVRAS